MTPASVPVISPTGATDEDLLTRKEASAFLIQFRYPHEARDPRTAVVHWGQWPSLSPRSA